MEEIQGKPLKSYLQKNQESILLNKQCYRTLAEFDCFMQKTKNIARGCVH